MQSVEADLAVIGAGPAGQKGAIQAAKAGKNVVLVDRMGLLGGACLHQGTIPSKALRRAILDLTGFLQSAYFGHEHRKVSMQDLTFRINKVIEDQNLVLEQQCRDNGVNVVYGSARFLDDRNIEVLDENATPTSQIKTDFTLIATGSRPRHPIHVPQEPNLFMDSDEVFRMPDVPESIVVLGAGIIGCEYATMFAALGVNVLLVDRRDEVLRMVDAEVGVRFRQYIEHVGVDIRLGTKIEKLRRADSGIAEIVLQDGGFIQAERCFYSMGRVANVEGMNLEGAGIQLNDMGNVPVNALFQTECPHIYAAGDVIGAPGLASTSVEQGRLAVRNAFLLKSHHFPEFFPYGIYTIPEISSVGPTEEELEKMGVHYAVGRAEFGEIARGPIAGDTTGLVKLIFHAETREVLSIHIIGTNATELIPIGQMAIDFKVRVDYFIDTIFNYPTFSEGFRIAALNGLNKLDSVSESDSV